MNLNTLIYKIWRFAEGILIIPQNKSKKEIPFSNTLTYAEKLIAAGMDPVRASVNAEISLKMKLYKLAIDLNLIDPIQRTKNIICDISIFAKKLLAAGEKKEVVELQSETLKNFVICLIITKFGSYSNPDQKWTTKYIKPEEFKHYSLKEFKTILKNRN